MVSPVVDDDIRIVGLSQRLLPITEHEERISSLPGVELRTVELWSEEDIVRNAADLDIAILGATEPFTRSVLAQLPRLRAIVRRGVGVDNVDVAAASESGIAVAFTPDASVEEVSDHALTLALTLERRIVQLDRAIHDGRWLRGSNAIVEIRTPVRRLKTLTLGIVGLGRIGRALAGKAQPIFGRVVGSDPFLSAEAAAAVGVELLPWSDLLDQADVISVHVPATAVTERMFDEAAFARMKATTTIVNTARGAVIDEPALVAAIRDGRLAGAALDVASEEPLPGGHPLLLEPSVILTGHSAASSTSSSDELRRRTADAVVALLSGETPASLVDPAVMDRPNRRSWER